MATQFGSLLSHLENKEKDRILSIESNILVIEELMKLGSQIPTSDSTKIKSADLAVQSTPPFFSPKDKQSKDTNKNSMGDAWIFFSSTEFAAENRNTKVYFVTENYKDFSSPSNPKILHEILRDIASESQLHYSINLMEVLKDIQGDLFTDEMIEEVEKFVKDKALIKSLIQSDFPQDINQTTIGRMLPKLNPTLFTEFISNIEPSDIPELLSKIPQNHYVDILNQIDQEYLRELSNVLDNAKFDGVFDLMPNNSLLSTINYPAFLDFLSKVDPVTHDRIANLNKDELSRLLQSVIS